MIEFTFENFFQGNLKYSSEIGYFAGLLRLQGLAEDLQVLGIELELVDLNSQDIR